MGAEVRTGKVGEFVNLECGSVSQLDRSVLRVRGWMQVCVFVSCVSVCCACVLSGVVCVFSVWFWSVSRMVVCGETRGKSQSEKRTVRQWRMGAVVGERREEKEEVRDRGSV